MAIEIEPGSIRDKMAACAETVVRNLIRERDRALRRERVAREGVGIAAVKGYAETEALLTRAAVAAGLDVTQISEEIRGIGEAFELDMVTDMDFEPAWMLRHRGVGEGDEGLPDSDSHPEDAEKPVTAGGGEASGSQLEIRDLTLQ